MKSLFTFKSLTFLLFLIIGVKQVDAQTVYTTRTGSKYHSEGCQYLRQSRIETTLREALNAGYSACSRCNPPLSGTSSMQPVHQSTTTEQYSGQCAATTKKGTRCTRTASAGSSYCWQHQ